MTRSDFDVDQGLFETLVAAAVQAPSSHNTQPWLFVRHPTAIDLLADRRRALPVNDPRDRELTISCGAALFNLRVAAVAAGLSATVAAAAGAADEDRLARVDLAHAAAPSPLAGLAGAIPARRTWRQPFADAAVDAAAVNALCAAAADEGATLRVLDGADARRDAAALVAEGDAAQWADPSWRRELAAWMHPRRRGDGLSMPALAVPVAQAVVRSFDMGHGVGAKDRQLADGSPLLAVLSTDGDAPTDWLAAGQALQRMLLVGVGHGLQASYLNQPVQVAALRPRLQHLAGGPAHPQLLLRFGHADKTLPAAARRPLAEVVEEG